MPTSRAEELEALRQTGRVKATSTALSATASTSFTTPQEQEVIRKQKTIHEKKLRVEAEQYLRQHKAGGLNDLFYRKLRDLKRRKEERERKSLAGYGSGGAKTAVDDDEGHLDTLEMLPDHVVSALKAKYETENAVEALDKALKEEEEGKGTYLADVMAKLDAAESKEEEDAITATVAEAETLEEVAEKEPNVDVAMDTPGETVTNGPPSDATSIEEEGPVEEVRSKIEQLSIEDVDPEAATAEDSIADEPTETADDDVQTEQEPTEPTQPEVVFSTEEQIEHTKQFYNTLATQFIANIDKGGDALTPSSHRDTFIGYIQQKKKEECKVDNTESKSFQIIDLGCGHGRDTLYFSSLGHHVLAIDYSYSMLHHAKTIAPHAHFLNMDMRNCKNALVDQSVDGIWASASLLHLPKSDMCEVLKGLYKAVRVGGVLYFSLKYGTEDQVGEAGELFESDTRYEGEGDARKLYSYFAGEDEVKELVRNVGWEILDMGEDDKRGTNDYITHSWMYMFATRTKE
ncbi:predicted protein [Thalassiosira pseudonana CCMP1335]|uniref:Methyltransferase domain-containing protein n=1 Tax=Thalassiosira pseudonana TaxID=35128 RepID=B8C7L7_THAPS|nr:predicted protein [Thalassiosira pseudonana CCMP1335]EED91003.1 predicted protein [Thalassiosira pseudonana CCMP1335]